MRGKDGSKTVSELWLTRVENKNKTM